MPWDFLDGEEAFRRSSLQENGDDGDDGSVTAIVFFRAALLEWFLECFRRRRGDLGGGGCDEFMEQDQEKGVWLCGKSMH